MNPLAALRTRLAARRTHRCPNPGCDRPTGPNAYTCGDPPWWTDLLNERRADAEWDGTDRQTDASNLTKEIH